MGMKQAGTDYGSKGETGEKEPKGAPSSDRSGTKSKGIVNGVGMGMEDKTGRSNGGKEKGEYNTGSSEGTCYAHKRSSYHKEDRSD